MDITKIPGIGKKTKRFYNEKRINKIGDILNTPLSKMIELFGKYGEWVWEVAHGLDKRPVNEYHNRKSISKERTFHEDVKFDKIFTNLEALNDRIHKKLQQDNISYRTVSIKIRSF